MGQNAHLLTFVNPESGTPEIDVIESIDAIDSMDYSEVVLKNTVK